MEKRADSNPDFEHFREFCGMTVIAPGRCSILFELTLWGATLLSGRQNIWAILDEVKQLEKDTGESRTKPATRFSNSGPLKGLWHKHFVSMDLRSMVLNIQNNAKSQGFLVDTAHLFEHNEGDPLRYLSENDIPKIAADFVGHYARRGNAKRLTGEWIIYAIYEGLNYYLCIANHDTPEEKILNDIHSVCAVEFPFLCSIIKPRT
jgi:hypothetical protein